MRKLNFAAVTIFCILAAGCMTAKAQKESKKFSVGFGFEAGLPLGNAKDAYHFTTGGNIRFSYHVGPGFVTLTTGATAWLPKSDAGDDTKASLVIPVKAGYKYIVHKPFFVMGELGYSSFKVYYKDGNGDLANSTSGGFTYAPAVGLNFDAFEIAIKYEATSLSGGTVSNLALRLGFNF
ncbi:MAG: outer membrane beta-barrel protein [Bacteroidota bacterium]